MYAEEPLVCYAGFLQNSHIFISCFECKFPGYDQVSLKFAFCHLPLKFNKNLALKCTCWRTPFGEHKKIMSSNGYWNTSTLKTLTLVERQRSCVFSWNFMLQHIPGFLTYEWLQFGQNIHLYLCKEPILLSCKRHDLINETKVLLF